MSETAADADALRRSIEGRVRGMGGALAQATPTGMMVVLAGAALWPIVAPLAGTGTVVAMVGAGIGLLGGPGQEFVSGFLKRLAARGGGDEAPLQPSQVQEKLERTLRERLEAEGEEAAALREDIGRLLRSVGGVESALAVASDEVKDALARGLAEASETWREFRWVLERVEDRLEEIQRRQAEGLALQRAGLDLQREQLVKTTLLLQLQSSSAAAPLPASDDDGDHLPPVEGAVCPYQGLHVFEPEDAPFFFGREALLADVLARLAEARVLVVVGPSGSGKSSFLRAGLVAAIWRGALMDCKDARVMVLTPTDRPIDELAMRVSLLRNVAAGSLLEDLRADSRHLDLAIRQALVGADERARVVLVVDQLEELFTLCRHDAERRLFLDALLQAQRAPGSRTILVLAIRADFYGRLAAHAELAGVAQDHQALVQSMRADDLRRVIEEPATAAGLSLETGLAETMLEDLGEEPGSLPLLSHALLETWARRRGRRLTLAGYRESGGVRGAIAKTAESVVGRLEPAQRAIARRVFVSLTQVGEGAEPTRRRVRISDLVPANETGAAMQQVLDVLAGERLVMLGDDTVEMAHEALLSHWPRLRDWLEEDREGLALHRRLSEAARGWENRARDPDELYRGARLAAASDWAEQRIAELQTVERDFLDASQKAETTELQAAKRRARRLRALVLVLASLVGIAALATTLAVRKTRDAQSAQRLALVRSLAADAQRNLDRNIHLAALLGLEALRLSSEDAGEPGVEVRSAVLSTLPALQQARGGLTGRMGAIALSPDGRTLCSVSEDDLLQLWDVRRRRPLGQPLKHPGALRLAFSGDGRTLASVSFDEGSVRVWDVRTRKQRALISHPMVSDVAFSGDGHTLAVSARESGNATVQVWDLQTHRPLGPARDIGADAVGLSPNGRAVTTASAIERDVQFWDARTGRPLRRPLKLPYTEHVAFSADGRTLVTASSDDHTAWVRDARTGRPLGPPVRPTTFEELALSNDRRTLVTLHYREGTVRAWDVRSRRPLGRSAPHPGTNKVALSADGRTLAAASADEVQFWDVRARRPLEQAIRHANVNAVAFSGNGRTLASTSGGEVRLWDLRSRRPLAGPVRQSAIRHVGLSDDFLTVVFAEASGRRARPEGLRRTTSETRGVRLWKLRNGQLTGQPLDLPGYPVSQFVPIGLEQRRAHTSDGKSAGGHGGAVGGAGSPAAWTPAQARRRVPGRIQRRRAHACLRRLRRRAAMGCTHT